MLPLYPEAPEIVKPVVKVPGLRERLMPEPAELFDVLALPLLQRTVDPAAPTPFGEHHAHRFAIVDFAEIGLNGLDLIQPDGCSASADRQEQFDSVAKLLRHDPKPVKFRRRRFLSGLIAGMEEFFCRFIKHLARRAFDPAPAEFPVPRNAIDQSGRVVASGPAFECDDQLSPGVVPVRLNLLPKLGAVFSAQLRCDVAIADQAGRGHDPLQSAPRFSNVPGGKTRRKNNERLHQSSNTDSEIVNRLRIIGSKRSPDLRSQFPNQSSGLRKGEPGRFCHDPRALWCAGRGPARC